MKQQQRYRLPRAICRLCGQKVTALDAVSHARRCTRRANIQRRITGG